MNINRRVTEIALVRALIVALGSATVARAGLAYLPLTGPPALRVFAAKSPRLSVPVEAAATSVKPLATGGTTNDIACLGTNADVYAISSGNPNRLTNLAAVTLGAGNAMDMSSGAQVFTLPSQDLFNITPQALATYFKPLNAGTNGLALAGPYRIGFIPPFAQSDKSSHAEYIVK